jgi:long-chain acyl-CoA synthetase
VPIFPSLAAEEVGYVLRNSGSRLVFYSDVAKRDLLIELQSALTSSLQVVAFDTDATVPEGMTVTRLLGRGESRRGDVPLERFRGRVEPDDLASIIYTSGTTGDPKGVMLSHRNLVSNFLAFGELFEVGPRDLAVSFLPMSHIFQRTVDHLCFYRGAAIHYVPDVEELQRALGEVRPTLLGSVPLLWERAYSQIMKDLESRGTLGRALGRWALGVGRRHAAEVRDGFVGPLLAAQRQLAFRLVLRDIRKRFGARLRLPISGGAPLTREVSEFFEAIGMSVFQGYGLTEASPVLATNSPRGQRRGSVGRPLPEVEIRVAEDGEILAKGPGVMRGYWENLSATRLSVDDDGWLHTGDIGEIDKSGFLYITDRKKDVIVTSSGESVAPQPIERELESHSLISQAVVVGDDSPYLAVLVVPDFDRLGDEIGERLSPEELVDHPEARRTIANLLAEVNARLGEHERLRRFRMLPRELTREAGELTPTYKVRRRVISRRFAVEIASLYSKPPP